MTTSIKISWINDFIFCPVSIYYHGLFGNVDKLKFQDTPQLAGTAAHKAITDKKYSNRKTILQDIDIFSDRYNIMGKIDTFDVSVGILTERKKKIKHIYEGYIFQLYAQFFCLRDMGYTIKSLRLYSMDDNKMYNILLPEQDKDMLDKFENTLKKMNAFNIDYYTPTNVEKCSNCIYNPLCDKSLI